MMGGGDLDCVSGRTKCLMNNTKKFDFKTGHLHPDIQCQDSFRQNLCPDPPPGSRNHYRNVGSPYPNEIQLR